MADDIRGLANTYLMTSEERDLITGLFNRLRAADTGSKDQEAEQLIGQLTGGQPGAPYRLVQTLLVQEHALNNATVRIQQLEKQAAQTQAAGNQAGQPQGTSGGFLSGLFGHHAAPAQPTQPTTIPPQQLPQPSQAYTQNAPAYPSTVGMAPSAGSGFLRGALQTAAGVAGGSLIAQGIEGLMGYHSGPFGGGFGGGGGFFGGGGYGGSGGGIVENTTEVINNNYVEERGGGQGFLGTGGNDPGYRETQREDNQGDVERGGGGGAFTDAGFDASNPFNGPSNDFGTPAVDNTFDADNTDAGNDGGNDFGGDLAGDSGDSGSSNDDGSLV